MKTPFSLNSRYASVYKKDSKNNYYVSPEIARKSERTCKHDFLVLLAFSHKHILKYFSTTALLDVVLAINP